MHTFSKKISLRRGHFVFLTEVQEKMRTSAELHKGSYSIIKYGTTSQNVKDVCETSHN